MGMDMSRDSIAGLLPDQPYEDELFHCVLRPMPLHTDIETLCGKPGDHRIWDYPEYFIDGLHNREQCPECAAHPEVVLFILGELP
jgi:hypothetical protein